jgi:hypothetical protein
MSTKRGINIGIEYLIIYPVKPGILIPWCADTDLIMKFGPFPK